MKAELLPLRGKYYGTKIKLTFQDGYEEIVELWDNGDGEPSDRELEGVCSIEQWRINALIPSKWTPSKLEGAKDAVYISDGHFESRNTHSRALELIKLING